MSGREWSKVSPAVWRSPRFLALKTSDERLLWLYFMTCDHQNSSGCYRIPDGYAIADLGWSLEQYRKCRELLVAGDCITFDIATSEVFVDRWFKHNPPTNLKHGKGTITSISKIESDELREKAEGEFAATEWGEKSLQVMQQTSDPLGPVNGNHLLNTSLMRGNGNRGVQWEK